MYIIINMLYTLQGNGRRKKAPEPSEERVNAEKIKKQIGENDAGFLDEYMKEALEQSLDADRGKRVVKMIEIVRNNIDKSLREDLGLLLADEVAKTVTRDNVVVWLNRRKQRTEEEKREEAERNQRKKQEKEDTDRSTKWDAKPKEEIIKEAFEGSRGSLAATLKRARLLTKNKITMDDVRKWRLENTNK